MTKTPSGWHDDARSRDAGHDEMQAEFYRDLLYREQGIWRLGRWFRFVNAVVEFPLLDPRDERIVAFADVAARYVPEDGDETDTVYRFYELKPEIHTVGGLIRQCHALSAAARRCRYAHEIFAVVYGHDAKQRLLEELYDGGVMVMPALWGPGVPS